MDHKTRAALLDHIHWKPDAAPRKLCTCAPNVCHAGNRLPRDSVCRQTLPDAAPRTPADSLDDFTLRWLADELDDRARSHETSQASPDAIESDSVEFYKGAAHFARAMAGFCRTVPREHAHSTPADRMRGLESEPEK